MSPDVWSRNWNDRPQGKKYFPITFRLSSAQSLKISLFSLIHTNVITFIPFFCFYYKLINWKTVCRLNKSPFERIYHLVKMAFMNPNICLLTNNKVSSSYEWMNDKNESRQLNISFERILSPVSILFIHSIMFSVYSLLYREQCIIHNGADESRTPMENVYIRMVMLIRFMLLMHWSFLY